jgi:hypothetical protein
MTITKTEPVSDFAGLLKPSKNGKNGLNTPTRGAFEDWLIEYRNRLAKVVQDKTKTKKNG